MAKTSKKKQANQYDKIFRENMEAALPGIIKNVLGLQIIRSVKLPGDLQHTKEREIDLLHKATDKKGNTFVLHIEYQTRNDKEMAERMADYNIMLLRKYKLPVKQYVLYFGKAKINMPDRIDAENFQFHYTIIDLSSIDYKLFLKSNKPEEKILAILANFEKDKPVIAIENILYEVKSSAKGGLAESKYFNQLRVLVQLRNLENQFNKAMESITEFFKEEKDPLFRKGETKGIAKGITKGIAKGREEAQIKTVTNLIEKFGFSDQQAADVADVPVEFVQMIRKKLKK